MHEHESFDRNPSTKDRIQRIEQQRWLRSLNPISSTIMRETGYQHAVRSLAELSEGGRRW